MTRWLIRVAAVLAALGLVALCVIAWGHHRTNTAPFAAVTLEDFEVEALSELHPRLSKEYCCDDSASLAPDPAGVGQVLSLLLRPTDPEVKGSKRSELRLPSGYFAKTTWYRARFRLDPDWSIAEQPVTILQWHGAPDKILGLEGNRPPPLRVLNWKGETYLVLNYDTSPRSFARITLFGERGGGVLWQGPETPGKWEDWVFRVVWTRRSHNGRVSAWRNGNLVANYSGHTAYADFLAPYLKFGLYVPHWKPGAGGDAPDATERRAMFDDIWTVYAVDADLPAEVSDLIERLSRDIPENDLYR